MFSQNAFGMKLDAVNGVLRMTNSHYLPLVSFGGDFQERREALSFDYE